MYTSGDDTVTELATQGTGQNHFYAQGGDDTIELSFQNISSFSHGHHGRGDNDGSSNRGADTFNFIDLQNVNDVIVGRIEDFDLNRDGLSINGSSIGRHELQSGSGTTGGYNWRIVEYDADTRDDQPDTQQWLLIDTGQGYVFYALEGARVTDGNGGSNGGNQESHFIGAANGHRVTASELAALETVGFIDPKNYVPAGYSPDGGNVIVDDDDVQADVDQFIGGSGRGDLIAAGLNDDSVRANGGNDYVWGGSGNDTVSGANGNDSIEGGFGHDSLLGEDGEDSILGDSGDDDISGGRGSDFLDGGSGADVIRGGNGQDTLIGGLGNDTLRSGNGDDSLEGGDGNDRLFGDDGADVLVGGRGRDLLEGEGDDDDLRGSNGIDTLNGGAGDDTLSGGKGNDELTGGSGADTFVFASSNGDDIITDFNVAVDALIFQNTTILDFSALPAGVTAVETAEGTFVQLDATTSVLLEDVFSLI